MAKKKKKKKKTTQKALINIQNTGQITKIKKKNQIYDQEKENKPKQNKNKLKLNNKSLPVLIENEKNKTPNAPSKPSIINSIKSLFKVKSLDDIKELPSSEKNKIASNKIVKKDQTNKNNKSRTIAKKEDVFSKIGEWFSNIGVNFKKKKVTNIKKKTPKNNKNVDDIKIPKKYPKNKFLKALVVIHENLFILYDTALIVAFIILILGMKRVLVIPESTIKYIALMVGFLSLVGISLNKYISGRILSIFTIAAMVGGIYYLNYTYDFINNYNTDLYEYQEYYVVAIENGRNKSIYNINNKRVGLLKDNSKNVERVLNTKLDNVKYITYTSQEELFIDFINNEYRAIIVKENQYKYIQNNNIKPDIKTKILYKFKVNSKKSVQKEQKKE